jgi:CDP-glycerol glycerophosphotransferase
VITPQRLLGALIRRRALLQQTLVYRSARKQPLSNAAVFQAFEGRTVGDSPFEIMSVLKRRNLGMELIYVVQSRNQKLPEGVRAVVHGSAEWAQALARSKFIVCNNNLPEFFAKREGQTYVQTWHGTPLKRLGTDITTAAASKFYVSAMAREAASWDYLISPSPYCTDLLPKALGFTGKVLESGYPRNDRLVTDSETRARVRGSLGVTDGETLVLYAPTWRDSKRTMTGAWAGVNFFDASLPDGFRLMFRGHNNTKSSHKAALAGGAIDVTNYPDVTDLFIAADILVTDYSSVMFDFSVTLKPMAFLVPDLAEYEANRGFYFDFRAEAPGPLFATATELVASIGSLGDYSAKYAAWHKKFNPHEDGKSAARVVKAVWGV